MIRCTMVESILLAYDSCQRTSDHGHNRKSQSRTPNQRPLTRMEDGLDYYGVRYCCEGGSKFVRDGGGGNIGIFLRRAGVSG